MENEITSVTMEDKYKIYKKKQSKIFNSWWNSVGSGITPIAEHDMDEHAKRVAYAAWLDRGTLISNDAEYEN